MSALVGMRTRYARSPVGSGLSFWPVMNGRTTLLIPSAPTTISAWMIMPVSVVTYGELFQEVDIEMTRS